MPEPNLTPATSAVQSGGKKSAPRHHDPLGQRLLREALAFRDEIVQEAGVILTRGMRGELPGSDAREQRLCAMAIRAERVPSASSFPTVAPKVIVQIADFARLDPMRHRSTPAALPQWNPADPATS